MILRNSKYIKLVALTAFLSIVNLVLNTSIASAEIIGKKKRLPVKVSALNTARKQVISPHLSIVKSFHSKTSQNVRIPNKAKSTQFKLTIPLSKQTLIANSIDGQASWYGPGFDGRQTANGETFNQQELTAAHPHLEFGTKVKVTNLSNGLSVIVRINDRGPFIKDRIIDLSAAAARSLNMLGSGVAPVRLTILGQ
jgi:rare lipoprotein A